MFEFWTGAEDLPVYGFLVRALIVYLYIFIMIKILGQRSMGSIDPLDFLFGVIIGDVVGEPLSSGEIPLGGPLAAAALIACLHLFLSYIALKMPRFRRVIEDEPIILMEKGKILHEQLRKVKMTTESLLMDIRLNGASIDEVDYAVLESNGQISIIKKSEAQSLTPKDMLQTPPPKGYPTVLIQDGHVIDANLKKVGTRSWLTDQLHKRGIRNYTEVFLLTMDEGGQIYFSKK
ncbi:YetF domain-containing protein [Anaerobacillus sp. MEB173]|uniref:YetF domain-containing protein n=1 Tax=Anaerobacillus sp. MEB173 TaxID=3383345 RepID=UPI003F8FADE5